MSEAPTDSSIVPTYVEAFPISILYSLLYLSGTTTAYTIFTTYITYSCNTSKTTYVSVYPSTTTDESIESSSFKLDSKSWIVTFLFNYSST